MQLIPAAAALLLAVASTQADAATWTVDTAKSHLGFTGAQNGATFTGDFGKFAGTIVFDPSNPGAGHADITIDAGSATTGDPQKDGSLPGSDWFSVNRFPQAHFVASGFKSTGTGAFEADGALTIRDITKPVRLPFSLAITGDQAKADGHVQLIRTDYGVGQGTWSNADNVALEVTVDFAIVAAQTAP